MTRTSFDPAAYANRHSPTDDSGVYRYGLEIAALLRGSNELAGPGRLEAQSPNVYKANVAMQFALGVVPLLLALGACAEPCSTLIDSPYSDPESARQWFLPEIGASTLPDPSDGEVVIAVLDNAVDLTHPELASRLWTDADGT